MLHSLVIHVYSNIVNLESFDSDSNKCNPVTHATMREFDYQSRLPTYSFGVFRGFLQNWHKYGLESLRQTPIEGIPPIIPDLSSCNWTYTTNQQSLISTLYFSFCVNKTKKKIVIDLKKIYIQSRTLI